MTSTYDAVPPVAAAAATRRPLSLVTSSMEGGGAQRTVAKLAAGFARRGYDVDLVLAHATGPFLAELPEQVRVVDLAVPRLATAVGPLVRYLRRARPAVVFSALDYVNIVTLAAHRLSRVDVPVVVSERNTLSAAVAHTTRRRTRLIPHLISRIYPWADAVVAVSQGVGDDLLATCGLPADRLHVLYNPVVTPEVARMRAEPVEHPWLRQRDVPTVLAVGRLMPQKDYPVLLEAFAQLRRRRPARLVILGEGPLRDQLTAQATRLSISEDVSMPGFCANPYPAMAAADAFVLPSRWEGLPGVLIEALFCGPPVVATDCPSGPREVLDGGRHGRLVPVGDAAAMATALEDALAGRVPRPTAESWQPYEQETVVDAYLELLLGLRAS